MDIEAKKEEFLRVYDSSADAIFRHCYFRIWNRERAKELMQETFMKTWGYLEQGKEVENLKAFLYKTATNLVIDDIRKKKEYSLDDMTEYGFDPGEDARPGIESAILSKNALELLKKLDSPYRETITMRYVEELSPKEIAEIMNESENTVSVRIHRGLKKLKNLLP